MRFIHVLIFDKGLNFTAR